MGRVYASPKRRVGQQRKSYREDLRRRKICIICFSNKVKPGVNPKTDRPYSTCPECIKRASDYYYRVRRPNKMIKQKSPRELERPAPGIVGAEASVWYDCCQSPWRHRADCRMAADALPSENTT